MIDKYLANVRESVNQQFLNIIKSDSQVSKAMLHTALAPSKCIRAGIVRAAAELEDTLNKESINNLQKDEKPYEEIINAEFSKIQENKNNEVNPRSHG